MDILNKYLLRKFIPFLGMLGSLTGAFVAAQHIANRQLSIITQVIMISIFIISGILIGVIASILYEKSNRNILSFNSLGKASVFKQKIYILTIFAIGLGYFLGLSHSTGFAIVCALTYGISFLSGLAIGIFDYKEVVSKQLLSVGLFPIGLSFVYAYYAVSDGSYIDFVWIFGSVYLFAYLLFINRIRLNAIIFFRNAVNVENSKSIRVANDILIVGFFSLFLIFFNFKKLISFGYDWVMQAVAWFFNLLAKIMDGLLAHGSFPTVEEPVEQFSGFNEAIVEQSLLVRIIIIVIAVAFILAMIVVVFFGIKMLIRAIKNLLNNFTGTGNSKKNKKISTKEYEEESEIVKSKLNKISIKREHKYLYTLKELSKLESDEEKLRYLYAFAIERLIINDIDIERSDTPIQILDKIANAIGGDLLNEEQFNTFTQEYRRVRYGYKPTMKMDFITKGKELEKRILEIKNKKDKKKI